MANRVGNHVGACPSYRNKRTNDGGVVGVKYGVVHAVEAYLKLRDVVLLRILQCTAVTAHKQKTSKMVFLLFVVIVVTWICEPLK
jgi:hypothetical protein